MRSNFGSPCRAHVDIFYGDTSAPDRYKIPESRISHRNIPDSHVSAVVDPEQERSKCHGLLEIDRAPPVADGVSDSLDAERAK